MAAEAASGLRPPRVTSSGSAGSSAATAAAAAAAAPAATPVNHTGRDSNGGDSAAAAALDELSQKVVQLTKVIVFLHTRSDGHESRCVALRAACEDEVRQLASQAASLVEVQRRHAMDAEAERAARLEARQKAHTAREATATSAIAELRDFVDSWHASAAASQSAAEERRTREVASVRNRAEHLCVELSAAAARARSDRHWLARQLAGEAARERQVLDATFEETSARLRETHAVESEQMRASREKAVAALRAEHSEVREAAAMEAEIELVADVERQESGLESERCVLEERAGAARLELAEARAASVQARQESAMQQHQLDEMSHDLQERRRRSRDLQTEADRAHSRRLKAEADMRELRRVKATIERSLGGGRSSVVAASALGSPLGVSAGSGSSTCGGGGGATSCSSAAPETERAIGGLSEEVSSAQAKLESLRDELQRSQRLLEERQRALVERGHRALRLGRELEEERKRSDELQRTLLRLEQGG